MVFANKVGWHQSLRTRNLIIHIMGQGQHVCMLSGHAATHMMRQIAVASATKEHLYATLGCACTHDVVYPPGWPLQVQEPVTAFSSRFQL